MNCNHLYDFMTGAKIQLPTVLRTGTGTEDGGRHGVLALLSPGEDAKTLIHNQMQMLAELDRVNP